MKPGKHVLIIDEKGHIEGIVTTFLEDIPVNEHEIQRDYAFYEGLTAALLEGGSIDDSDNR